jgi:hypothetical protein
MNFCARLIFRRDAAKHGSEFAIMSDTNRDRGRETYSEEETAERADRALKRMLTTPHKPHKGSKKGK